MPEALSRRELLERVQAEVNAFAYVGDIEQFGRPDFWERISRAGVGDCEDYALEKRARLLAAGVPAEDLRIACCFTETGEYHAILIARDGAADWILDQRLPRIATADELRGLGYRGDRIQAGQAWERWEL